MPVKRFEQPFKCCRDTNIQSFQFRIIHRIIPCNQWLKNVMIKKSEQCNYCGDTDDSCHFFYTVQRCMNFGSIGQTGGTVSVIKTLEKLII